MLGAIAGDIIGSTYEVFNTKNKNFNLYRPFSRYTDDTVLTIATADCILNDGNYEDYYKNYCLKNQFRGYGSRFYFWAMLNKKESYNSMGNGSAMRVSPIGYISNSLEEVMELAKLSASVTHNHPEGIKGAQAIATAIYMFNNDYSKKDVKEFIEHTFSYDLSLSYSDLKSIYTGGETCPLTVPQAIISFLESTDFEDAIRNAISLGGDSDTLACMTGAIAEAYYKGIPPHIEENTLKRLKPKFIKIINEFRKEYMPFYS